MKCPVAKQNRLKIGLQVPLEALRFFRLCNKPMLIEHGKPSSESASEVIRTRLFGIK